MDSVYPCFRKMKMILMYAKVCAMCISCTMYNELGNIFVSEYLLDTFSRHKRINDTVKKSSAHSLLASRYMYFPYPFKFHCLASFIKLSINRRRFLFCMIPNVNFQFTQKGAMLELECLLLTFIYYIIQKLKSL